MKQSVPQLPKKRSAVLLLSGFLGAGKTTLLKRILGWETELSGSVVLVNEFGDVGIDGDLLKNSGLDVVELTSGCICCTLSADLKQSLARIWERYQPRRIFIEASGVADPTAILQVLNDTELKQSMSLEKVITVLDADYWEARDNFGPLFYNQLATAHLILLNKVDLMEEDKIPVYLKEIHELMPGSQVIPTVRCNIEADVLQIGGYQSAIMLKPMRMFQPISLQDLEGGSRQYENSRPNDHKESVSASHFVTFSFQNEHIMEEPCFKEFLEKLPWEVFRVKGAVRFPDRTEFLNYVGGKGEWFKWDDAPETRLAFIGWKVNAQEYIDRLLRCLS